MNAVNIKIYSEQLFGEQRDIISETYAGKIKKVGTSIYITHSNDGVQTLYKYMPGRLLVRRSGQIEQVQEFIPGKNCASSYLNTGIKMEINTLTQDLSIVEMPQGSVIYLEYILYINNTLQGITKMTITVTERIEH